MKSEQNSTLKKDNAFIKHCLLIIILINIFSINTFAQENKTEEKNHLLTGAVGYTYIPDGTSMESDVADGIFVPSLGIDYFYRLTSKWKIGVMSDFEFGEYVIIQKELNRKNAIVVTAIVAYSLTHALNLFAGAGMEFERHHNLTVFRIGSEYTFKFNKGWILAPGLFLDLKEGYDTWSLSLSFGKEF